MRVFTPLVLPFLALAVGCGPITVSFHRPPTISTHALVIGEGVPALSLDEMGNLILGSDPLLVESHSEQLRFGVTAVDLGQLPRSWRPHHLADFEGPVVTSLYVQSPVAIAGLRPFHGIESIDGAVLDSAKSLAEQLAAKQTGETVTLGVIAPNGRHEVTAKAAHGVSDSTSISLPFIYTSRKSALETFVQIGPLPLSRYHEQLVFTGGDDTGPWSGYVRSVSWKTFLSLIAYQGSSTLDGKPLYSQWRILWFITFGNSDEQSSS